MTNHNWQSILKTALAKLRKFAGRTDFDISLQKIFGVAGEDTALLKQAWLNGNFGTLPNLEIIAGSQINNARGAFAAATNTLYLSEELIKTADLNAITAVFLEEYGHYLDSILNYQDTAGDEGEYFAAVVTGEDLSLWDIARLQTENDQVVVTLAGQAVAIEQNLPIILLGLAPANINENNTSGVFTFSRSGDTSSSLAVNYTIGGTATNGTDYGSLSGTVTFAAGSAIATVVVNPIDDTLYEGAETVTLTLTAATTYTFGNSTATLKITDNDLAVTQLTNNNSINYSNDTPAISGNNVVWRSNNSNVSSIFFYNGINTIQLTNGYFSGGFYPQISGNNVVWTGYDGTDNEIFFYNGTSTTQLTNNIRDDLSPAISGNNVVWSGSDGTDYEIYLYNGVSIIQLTNNSYNDFVGGISGNNVVWSGSDGTDYEIYLYNGTSTIQLTNNSFNDYGPAISGNNVFWSGYDGTDYEIYLYNGISTIQLTNNSYDDSAPQISGNNVVWTGYDGTDNEIFFYNGTSTIQLTNNSFNDYGPAISGNNVVWYNFERSGEIFFYNGTITIQLTNNGTGGGYSPAISGNNVVWSGYDGNFSQIYKTNLDPISPTITVAATDANAGETLISGTPNPGVFTLTRIEGNVNSLTVNYTITGTSTNGTDYSQLTGTATFAAGSSTTTITVTPTNDSIFEGNETVTLTLATGTGYNIGTAQTATVTIADNDAIPQVSINDVTITEGNSGTGNANFIVSLSNPSNQTITVAYQTGNISAVAGTDYITQTGTITFNPGEVSKTVGVIVNGDTLIENNETFKVNLSTPVNATIADGEGIGTINNDDIPTITVNNLTVVEGVDNNATMTFTLSTPLNQGVSVNYSTTASTATANSDYTPVSGTLTIAAGATTGTLSIPIVNDNLNEPNETFNLALSNPVGAVLVNANPVITITDTIQSSTTFTLPAGVENLQLIGTAAINGTGNTGDNIFTGNRANNILAGGNGNDTYSFNAATVLGSDTIQETLTGGVDVIDLTGTTGAATLNLGLTTIQTIVANNLRLTLTANIENIIGGNGADRLIGNSLDNNLVGGLGNDNLRGNGGNDSLTGGVGNDILTGDAGTDRFIYSSGRAYTPSDIGLDLILDFTTGTDKFVLSKTTFNTLQSVVGNGLSQGSDLAVVNNDDLVNTQAAFIVYSSASGNLFYNQNGITAGLGTGAAFVDFFNQPTTLTTADFIVIA
jgi:beta propeller repeat protein